jgi:SAM-dependent methyltransferase
VNAGIPVSYLRALKRRIRAYLALIRSRIAGRLGTWSRHWQEFRADMHSGMQTEDRFYLEQRIFPYFLARATVQDILFVGVAWYTHQYERTFADRRFWTMELDPDRRRFGARRHITDSVSRLDRYFEPGSLDLIIINGVVGFGLNDPDEFARTIEACHEALRPGGVLVLGWNDIPSLQPFAVPTHPALSQFEPLVFPPLGTCQFTTTTDNRHTYSFLQRPQVIPQA